MLLKLIFHSSIGLIYWVFSVWFCITANSEYLNFLAVSVSWCIGGFIMHLWLVRIYTDERMDVDISL